MAKKNEVKASEANTNDNFLPEGAGWVEVSSSGAAIYKPEAAVAEDKPLMGIAYDTILALGGSSECGVWEAIVVRTTQPTVAFKDGEQVEVPAGEDVLIAANALLSDVVRRSRNPRVAQHVKLMPTQEKEHATRKGWRFWEYRIAFGPTVDRVKENLMFLPEREDIAEKLFAYEEGVKNGTAKGDDGSKRILASFHSRLRLLESSNSVPQLQA